METTETQVQPIGQQLAAWQGATRPIAAILSGRYCEVAPLNIAEHAAALFAAFSLDETGQNWTYLLAEPPPDFAEFSSRLRINCRDSDPLFYVIIDKDTQLAIGIASLMRIDPDNGVIEVGHIHFSTALQRTPLATEAMYLLMKQVFDWGYRRYEWKCDNLNAPSKKAALRLGFSFEGIFRQMLVYKARNRDTAWFSILDSEWPRQKNAFERWLAVDNFDQKGQQRQSLSAIVSKLAS